MRSDIQRLSKGRSQICSTQRLLLQTPCGPDYSGNQPRDQKDIVKSVRMNEDKYPWVSKLSECRCRSTDWEEVLRFGNRRFLLQHSKAICEDCPIHRSRVDSSTVALRHKGEIPFLPGSLELVVLFQRRSRVPAIGISLRIEARVKVLPLYSFFWKLYHSYLYSKRDYINGPSSTKTHDYLISVTRKMLLQAFQSGSASPDDVDGQGRTLLHVGVHSAFS